MSKLHALLLVAAFAILTRPVAADESLVGTWRIVSYPTSEGDLLRRHGRPPGPLPDAKASLDGWSYLVFAKDGQCGLFMPQKVKDQPPHRRVTWFHDEDNFATWKLDSSQRPWRLDLGSVLTPKFQTVKSVDAKTGQPIAKRAAAVDPKTNEVIGQRWTYPAVCRIDGDVLTLVWWQNHRLLENPPEEQRPKMVEGLPGAALAGLRAGKPLLRDDPRVKIPGGISCLIAQRFSLEPMPIMPAPPLREVLGK